MAGHLPLEQISALQDGELSPGEAASARAHLSACSVCRADQTLFASLADELRLPPAVGCEAAGLYLSARTDGEADGLEIRTAERHVNSCPACRLAASAWPSLDQTLVGSPAVPSARVDRAMAALAGRRAPRRALRPVAIASGVGGAAWRGAVVAVVAIAVMLGGTIAPPERQPDGATTPRDLVVAGVQQIVLDPSTNTLYIARPEAGAVKALDATTHAERAHIFVGGRPTALALNGPDQRIIVLDAEARRFTEIDTQRNTVVRSTPIEVAGTPTGLTVESGKVVVFTALAARPATSASPAPAASGQVAVFDTATSRLETVRTVDVAPRLVIPEPSGRRTLLVSAEATTLVDGSYRPVARLAGGVSAAFGENDRIAVLAADSSGGRLTFHGAGAPPPVALGGRPTAVVALPDGGFAVLTDVGGRGRIVVVDAAGREGAAADVELAGRDLAYDAASGRFTVIAGEKVAFVNLPGAVAHAPSPAPVVRPSPIPSPAPAAAPSPAASPPPSPPPGTAVTSPSPAASPTPAPTPAIAGVPTDATRIDPELFRVALPAGRMPVLVHATSTRIWFTDRQNRLAALDTASGRVFTLAELPRDAELRALAAGPTHVYVLDVAQGRLFEMGIRDELVTTHRLPLGAVSAMHVGNDGVVWIAQPVASEVLSFGPLSKRIEMVDLGIAGPVALTTDKAGRLWFSNGANAIGWFDPVSRRVAHLGWRGITPQVLHADPFGQVWAGSANGDIHFLKDTSATLLLRSGRPVSAIALDARGRPWYLTTAPAGAGMAYGPVDGSRALQRVPGPASGLAFTEGGRAWSADLSGGFFVGLAGR